MSTSTDPRWAPLERLDTVELLGLTARGRHGVLPAERELGQEFVVDVVLHVDTRPAAATDDLADAVSYADVATAVHRAVTGEPVDLLEALAARDPEALTSASLAHRRPTWDAVEAIVRRQAQERDEREESS